MNLETSIELVQNYKYIIRISEGRSGRVGMTVVSVLLGAAKSKSTWVRTPPSPSRSTSLFLYHRIISISYIHEYRISSFACEILN